MWRLSDLDKQTKASWYAFKKKKTLHNQSFRPPHLYFWRTYWQKRKVCRKGDRSAWCLARTKVEKQALHSSSTMTPNPSPSLPLFSFWPLLFLIVFSFNPSSSVVIVFSFSVAGPALCLPPHRLVHLACASCIIPHTLLLSSPFQFVSPSLSAFLHVFLAMVPFPQLA